MNRFERADALRILRISPRQLSGWQKAGLVAVGESFSFFDLLQLKKVRDLRAKKVTPSAIKKSLEAMQRQVAGMENPLIEASSFNIEPAGTLMESPKVRNIDLSATAAEFFAKGVSLEDDPNCCDEAIEAYEKVLELDDTYAPAHINLGTLFYNQGDYVSAEKHYRSAIACDSRYALAYFDLANVLDETGRLEEAIENYRSALQLAPTYADAHYNLALAYEKLRQPRKALNHWKMYVKLDANGPWAVHARNQIKKILQGEKLQVIFRR